MKLWQRIKAFFAPPAPTAPTAEQSYNLEAVRIREIHQLCGQAQKLLVELGNGSPPEVFNAIGPWLHRFAQTGCPELPGPIKERPWREEEDRIKALCQARPGSQIRPFGPAPVRHDYGKDSVYETTCHISRVQELMDEVLKRLEKRAWVHDQSKLKPPELQAFDKAREMKSMEYSADPESDYQKSLRALGPALKHHYEHNSHHPEHYPDGIAGMSLLDLVEMFCDWKAAGERHETGSMQRSLAVNAGRFKIEPQLLSILDKTAAEMQWYTNQAQS